MPTQTEAIQQLAAVINNLYDLAGADDVTPAQRQALVLQAHDLRGDLVTMVSMSLSQTAAGYQGVIDNLNQVTSALNAAEADIQKIGDVVNGAAQLAKSIDDLLKTAVAAGAKIF